MRTWFGAVMVGLLVLPNVASGEMSSNNFRIYADSIGLNGGDVASSTSYFLNDTFNDNIGGQSVSTTYTMYGGYQAMDTDEVLGVSLSETAIGLGTVGRTEVSSDTVIATVTTNASNGFSLSISDVSGSFLAAVSDGSVTAASEEYGVAVTGSYAAFADDRSVIAGRLLASSGGQVTGATTTLIFKAAAAGNTSAGNYSQTLTITASANF